MQSITRQRWAQALLFVVPALWSSNFVIARLANGVVLPHQLALGRWLLAGLLMLPFVWGGLRRAPDVLRAEWRQCLVLGALGMYICGAWVYLGAHTTPAVNMALIFAAAPVAITVLGVKLLREPMSRAQWAAVGLAVAGVLLVIARGDPRQLLSVRFSAGDSWILACTVAWTLYSVLLRRWPSRLDPAVRLSAITAGGVLVLLPFTVLEAWTQPALPFTPLAVGLVVLAALLPGVLSYTAYSYLQRELGASRTALMLYLAPIYGALGAWAVLGEAPSWYHAAGAALILPGIWLATRR